MICFLTSLQRIKSDLHKLPMPSQQRFASPHSRITGLVQCVYVKLCNGRVGGWGLLWQVSLDFILQLSVVPLFACADLRSTMSMLYMNFSCCFGCFVEFVITIIFCFLCCNMWNDLAVNDLEVLLWRFHQMICWLYFSLMLVDFHFWQGRLG